MLKTIKQKPSYEKVVLSAKKQFIQIAGKEAWERESSFALENYFNFVIHTLKRYDAPDASSLTPIQACTPDSIRQSMLNIAYTGITLNPVFQEAYLTVKDGKCFLDFSYRGLIKIATSEGSITSLSAGVVYTWDKIDYRHGTDSYLHVIPDLKPPKDPDEIARNPKLIWEHLKCAYSVATFPNGTQDFIILPKWKLLKNWNSIEKNAINEAYPEEWIRKTAIRYHSKTLPHAQRLVTAVAVLNEHEGTKKNKKSESRLMKRMKK